MTPAAGQATGPVRLLLRLEGAAVAILAGLLAWRLGAPWPLAIAVLLAPDLSILAYRLGAGAGAACYNAAHSYLGPALLAALSWAGAGDTVLAVAALWALHIGVDRALGFGLKNPSGFRDTHLGPVGQG